MRNVDSLHLRVLRLLRDQGAISRAELADRLQIPRPRLLAELDRLVATGFVAEAGMAASRGGRRSTLVELNPDLRFAAVDLGASSIDVEVTNGRLEPLAAYNEAADIRSGPQGDPASGQRAAGQGQGGRSPRSVGLDRYRGAGPGQLPRRGAGIATDHARLGPLPGARTAYPGARLPSRRGQRREHHGDRRATRRGRSLGGRFPVRQDWHRRRLRDLPDRWSLPGHRRLCWRHRSHSGRVAGTDVLLRQRRMSGGAVQRSRADQGRHCGGPLR